ncbi:MAG: ABC transporter ATP-binding protein [Reyranella sp.]|uniref:ABC transporter ATP-binding protein n=1 Tax=Reyranella sp. TaxID=1929291 RepID=UPI0011F8B8FB|nr:ABC transporter ATP-binding protein [Reyranella sp.]TAJ40528.1 MAG: ABC transporter ATP-binding protein [Reyranella sp.]
MQALTPAAAAIELRGIEKSFGSVHAVRGVSLRIETGTITGIVGENGAGKSTLMSILYGLYRADAGEIWVDGQPVEMASPRDAIAHGIGMVHQHFMLIDSFTVLENMVLGAEGGLLLAGGLAAARAELARLARDYGLSIDPDVRVANLSVGEQQRVEILKVLFRGARILILDEPSAVLTPQETDRLFRILQTLRERGVTVVLITHKLREIMAATDRVYVMRQGRMVVERRTRDTSSEELAELMVGRKVRLDLDKAAPRQGEILLRAEHLSLVDDRGVRLLDDVGIELRAGEIVGIAGVTGNGQSELLQVLAGIRAPSEGRLTVCGRTLDARHPGNPADMRVLGLAHVPEDRLRQGMVAAFEASETSILGYQDGPPFTRHYLLDGPAVGAHCAQLMERFDVRPRSPGLRSSHFSGGNQQKLVLAREIARQPKVLLVGQPTRGVDIGAIEFIHRELVKARDAGCAVLVVSVELDEILSLADRILVMFAGRIVGEVEPGRADERRLGLMMAGADAA